ncbi:hypothetical protein S83_031092 [Arachis hypogaea]
MLRYWFLKAKKQGRRTDRKYSFRLSFEDFTNLKEFDSTQNSDLPFFDLSSIAAATDYFSPDNKLGQGGFGSVYKGLLNNGKEIALHECLDAAIPAMTLLVGANLVKGLEGVRKQLPLVIGITIVRFIALPAIGI